MALSRSNQFDSGTVLTESKLEGEFDNIYNNALSLISPLTGNLAVGDFNLTGIGELAFNDDGAATAVGRLRRNGNNLTWHDRIGAVNLQMLLGGGIFGLALTNDAGDLTNDIGIAVGVAVNSTQTTTMRLGSALIKQLDVAWAVGTNAGGRMSAAGIANTTYHVHQIIRPDTGVVDIGFDTSATAPTLPTSYTLFRRIGSILRESATIVAFTQDGDYFRRNGSILDIDVTGPGTAAVTRTLSVPTGINVVALGQVLYEPQSAAAGYVHLSDLAATDEASSRTAAPLGMLAVDGNTTNIAGSAAAFAIRTNTSAQIRSRVNVSAAGTIVKMATLGWIDTRGRNA